MWYEGLSALYTRFILIAHVISQKDLEVFFVAYVV